MVPLSRRIGICWKTHDENSAEFQRTFEASERKGAALYRKKATTSARIISEHVRRAKYILMKMTEHCELGEGDEAIKIADDILNTRETEYLDLFSGNIESQRDIDRSRRENEEEI